MEKIKEGKWIVALNGREIIIGKVAVSEPDLLAVHPVAVKHGETRGIHPRERLYLLDDLIYCYENRTQGSQRPARQEREQRFEKHNTDTEKIALAICCKIAEKGGNLSAFLDAIDEEDIRDARLFLQEMVEKNTEVDWRDFSHKASRMPEGSSKGQ